MDYEIYAEKVIEEIKRSLLSVESSKIALFIKDILAAPQIFCDGKGRSALPAKSFAMRLAQMGITVFDVDGVTTPAINKDDFLIIASGSGETPNLIEHADVANRVGAKVVLISTDKASTLKNKSDYCFQFHAKSKQEDDNCSIHPMGTLFEQSVTVFFDIIVLLLMDKKKISGNAMYDCHKNLE